MFDWLFGVRKHSFEVKKLRHRLQVVLPTGIPERIIDGILPSFLVAGGYTTWNGFGAYMNLDGPGFVMKETTNIFEIWFEDLMLAKQVLRDTVEFVLEFTKEEAVFVTLDGVAEIHSRRGK